MQTSSGAGSRWRQGAWARRTRSPRATPSTRGARGWPTVEPSGAFDVVVLGGTVLGLMAAWRLAALGARVALLSPDLVGADWPARRGAWLHRHGLAPALAALVGPSRALYRSWAAEGALGVQWSDGGHVTLACTVEDQRAADRSARRLEGIAALDERALPVRAPVADPAAVLGAWDEPAGSVAWLEELPWDLAAAAAGCGAVVGERERVERMDREGGMWRLLVAQLDGGALRSVSAPAVLDASPDLALGLASAEAPRAATAVACDLVGAVDRWLITEPAAPIIAGSIGIGPVDIAQAPAGEVVVRVRAASVADLWGAPGLAALGPAAAAITEVLPAVAALRLVRSGTTRALRPVGGTPLIGELADGLWCCGGLGVSELTVGPAVGDAVAHSMIGGRLDARLAGLEHLPSTVEVGRRPQPSTAPGAASAQSAATVAETNTGLAALPGDATPRRWPLGGAAAPGRRAVDGAAETLAATRRSTLAAQATPAPEASPAAETSLAAEATLASEANDAGATAPPLGSDAILAAAAPPRGSDAIAAAPGGGAGLDAAPSGARFADPAPGAAAFADADLAPSATAAAGAGGFADATPTADAVSNEAVFADADADTDATPSSIVLADADADLGAGVFADADADRGAALPAGAVDPNLETVADAGPGADAGDGEGSGRRSRTDQRPDGVEASVAWASPPSDDRLAPPWPVHERLAPTGRTDQRLQPPWPANDNVAATGLAGPLPVSAAAFLTERGEAPPDAPVVGERRSGDAVAAPDGAGERTSQPARGAARPRLAPPTPRLPHRLAGTAGRARLAPPVPPAPEGPLPTLPRRAMAPLRRIVDDPGQHEVRRLAPPLPPAEPVEPVHRGRPGDVVVAEARAAGLIIAEGAGSGRGDAYRPTVAPAAKLPEPAMLAQRPGTARDLAHERARPAGLRDEWPRSAEVSRKRVGAVEAERASVSQAEPTTERARPMPRLRPPQPVEVAGGGSASGGSPTQRLRPSQTGDDVAASSPVAGGIGTGTGSRQVVGGPSTGLVAVRDTSGLGHAGSAPARGPAAVAPGVALGLEPARGPAAVVTTPDPGVQGSTGRPGPVAGRPSGRVPPPAPPPALVPGLPARRVASGLIESSSPAGLAAPGLIEGVSRAGLAASGPIGTASPAGLAAPAPIESASQARSAAPAAREVAGAIGEPGPDDVAAELVNLVEPGTGADAVTTGREVWP